MKFPSIKQVNRLYLITLLLVLVFGTIMQLASFSWGLLGTEILLILLPVVLFYRKNKASLLQESALQRPPAAISLVAVMLGGGAWLIDSIIDAFMIQISGYTLPAPDGILPTNWFQALVIFTAFAIAAPICEEFLFRGTLQRAYHHEKNPVAAILITSLLFVVFHLRFQGFVSLIPIALILGYTYWRTRSLAAVMLVHFANNALASVVLIQAGLFPAFNLPFPSVPAAAFGVLLVVAGLFLLTRLTVQPEAQPQKIAPPSTGWRTYWPLLVALVIFAIMAVVEVISGTLMKELQLDAAQMPQQTTRYTYQVRHKGGEPVGELSCVMQPEAHTIILDCTRTVAAFEYQSGNSFYSSLEMETAFDVEWNQETLALQHMTLHNSAADYGSQWQLEQSPGGLIFSLNDADSQITETFPLQTLVEDEWPWRLMGLSFAETLTSQFNYLEPLTWREKTKDSGPLLTPNAYLVLSGPKEITTPAGSFDTWEVTLSNQQTAWYDVNAPHTVVQVEGRMFDTYLTDLQLNP